MHKMHLPQIELNDKQVPKFGKFEIVNEKYKTV